MTTTTQPAVTTIRQVTSNGRHVRMATKVTFADGRAVTFLEKLGKAEAIRQAEAVLARR